LIRVEGHDLAREPEELKRRLGFMPDFSPVYDRLTATEYLDHFARAYDVPRRERRVAECLELTWLSDKRDAHCEELSRGMKQRLVLAKTLLPDPDVLLLDEPASGLDPLGRIELWKLLMQQHDAGKAVLISSHILSELSSFCNTAAIMERGVLIAFGAIADLSRQADVRRMSVKWRANTDKALEILNGAPGVQRLHRTAQGAEFEFERDEDALHELLRLLILKDVHVTEWRALEDNLEQIFLRSGAKAVT